MIVAVYFENIIIVRCPEKHRVTAREVLDPVDAGFFESGRDVQVLGIGKIVDWDAFCIDAGAGPIMNAAAAKIIINLAATAVPNATGIIYVDALGIDGPIIPEAELVCLVSAVAATIAPPPANALVTLVIIPRGVQ